MESHKSFGGVKGKLDQAEITVGGSAAFGKPSVAVHAKSRYDHFHALLSADDARLLAAKLCMAAEHADHVAMAQQAASVPHLEDELAKARQAKSQLGKLG